MYLGFHRAIVGDAGDNAMTLSSEGESDGSESEERERAAAAIGPRESE